MTTLWRRAVVTLLVMLVASLAVVSTAARDTGDDFEATGILNFGNANHEHVPELSIYVPESGGRYTLYGAEEHLAPYGGYFPLLGKSISVNGQLVDDGTAIEVSELQLAEITPFHHIDIRDGRHWIGSQHYLNALCRFPDSVDDPPAGPSYFQNELLPALNEFWDENSYGQAHMEFTTSDWVDLPEDWAYYIEGDLGDWWSTIMHDCANAAADSGVDVHQFDGINMMFDRELDGRSYGNVRTFEVNDVVGTWGITWMAQPHWQLSETSLRPLHVTLHEIGHSVGLPHSCATPEAAYGSVWDFMSSGEIPHTIAIHRDKLGWIDESYKYVPTDDTNQVIFLERLGHPNLPLGEDEYLMVEIPVPGSDSRWYTAEARMQFGDFESHLPTEQAVVMHEVDLLRQVPHPLTGQLVSDCQAVVVSPEGFPDAMRPNLGPIFEFPGENFEMNLAPMHETDTGTWVVINADLELDVSAPDTAIAGEQFDIEVSLLAGGEPVSFAEGWRVLMTGFAVDVPPLDENGETIIPITRNVASPFSTTIRVGYLTQDVTVEMLPADPHSVVIDAFPSTQILGETVSLSARVQDEFGNNVIEGTEVTFDVSGTTGEDPVPTDNGEGWIATTNAHGIATLSYTRLFPSLDTVIASAGDDPVVTSDQVDVTWALPATDEGIQLRAQTQQPRENLLNLAVNAVNEPLTGSVVFDEDPFRFTSTDLLSATVAEQEAVIYLQAEIRNAGMQIVRIDLHDGGENGSTGRVRWIGHDSGEFSVGRVSFD